MKKTDAKKPPKDRMGANKKPRNPFEELRKLGFDKHFRKLGMTVSEYINWVRGSDEEDDKA